MFPHGIIYEARKGKTSGEVILSLSFAKKLTYNVIRGVGGGLISFFIVGVLFSVWPLIKDEIWYANNHKDIENTTLIPDNYYKFALEAQEISETQKEAILLGVDSYFSIVIPKINAKSKIIPNVDTSDEVSYNKALRDGVAHAKGTFFPGQGKNVYLFAHSTDTPLNIARYNAVFYLLRKLEIGDEIIVFFADQKYVYQVTEKKVTDAKDTSWLMESDRGEELVLQTCYPPGTTLKRLIVVAKSK